MATPVLVIGIGQEYRSDDGVGLVVIRLLKAKGLPEAVLMEANGDGVALLDVWATATSVILVDAVASGGRPGTIHHFDALTQPMPTELSFSSTHAFGVAEALELARTLQQLPPSMIIYGIEGKGFDAGKGLSPEVEQAAHEVVEQIVRAMQVRDHTPELS